MVSPDKRTTVERILEKQGRNMTWLAEQTLISQTYAWRMLRGERPMTSEFKAATARALGVPEDVAFPAETIEQAS